MSRYVQVAYTGNVRAVQKERDSPVGRRMPEDELGAMSLSEQEAAFLATRDGFYLSSVGETGWPYIQFRGGPPGFLHSLDEHTIAFADVRGNRQYITTGNARGNDRVALFLMDYPTRSRLKVFGHLSVLGPDENPALTERLTTTRTDGRVEALMVIRVEAYAWNCHQHIVPRFSEAELEPLLERLRGLEAENNELRADLARAERS